MDLNRLHANEHHALAVSTMLACHGFCGYARRVALSVLSLSFGKKSFGTLVVHNVANVRNVTAPSLPILPKGPCFRLHPRFRGLQ